MTKSSVMHLAVTMNTYTRHPQWRRARWCIDPLKRWNSTYASWLCVSAFCAYMSTFFHTDSIYVMRTKIYGYRYTGMCIGTYISWSICIHIDRIYIDTDIQIHTGTYILAYLVYIHVHTCMISTSVLRYHYTFIYTIFHAHIHFVYTVYLWELKIHRIETQFGYVPSFCVENRNVLAGFSWWSTNRYRQASQLPTGGGLLGDFKKKGIRWRWKSQSVRADVRRKESRVL